MRALVIRSADARDAAAIAEIYGHYVLYGTGTFEELAPSANEMAMRLARVQGRSWPWLVAEHDDCVVGFAYAAQFRDRAAYRYAAEDSIYVHPDHLCAGVGRALIEALLPAAAAAGFRRLFAVIGDSANAASIRLHQRAGFALAGQLDQAGFKFGRYLDIVFMQRSVENPE